LFLALSSQDEYFSLILAFVLKFSARSKTEQKGKSPIGTRVEGKVDCVFSTQGLRSRNLGFPYFYLLKAYFLFLFFLISKKIGKFKTFRVADSPHLYGECWLAV